MRLGALALASAAVLVAAVLVFVDTLDNVRHVPSANAEQPATDGDDQGGRLVLPDDARVLVVGDSYTVGYGATDPTDENWVRVLSAAMGWTTVNDGVIGSGYTVTGDLPASTFAERLSRHADEPYDLVILQGSQNDVGQSTLRSAAERALQQARAQWPQATIVSIGPDAPLPAAVAYDDVVSTLRQAASAADVRYIDPVEEGWLTTANSERFTALDGQHLNTAGYAMMASEIAGDFRRWQRTPVGGPVDMADR